MTTSEKRSQANNASRTDKYTLCIYTSKSERNTNQFFWLSIPYIIRRVSSITILIFNFLLWHRQSPYHLVLNREMYRVIIQNRYCCRSSSSTMNDVVETEIFIYYSPLCKRTAQMKQQNDNIRMTHFALEISSIKSKLHTNSFSVNIWIFYWMYAIRNYASSSGTLSFYYHI